MDRIAEVTYAVVHFSGNQHGMRHVAYQVPYTAAPERLRLRMCSGQLRQSASAERQTGARQVAKKKAASGASKPAAKRAAATKKASAKKPSKKAAAKKAAAKKAPAKKAPAKKAPAKKAAAKKAPAKKAAAKKAPAKKAAAKKAPASPSTKKAAAKKAAPATKKAVRSSVAKKSSAAPDIPSWLKDKKWLKQQRAALLEERAKQTSHAEVREAEAAALMADRDPGDVQFDEESGEGDTLAVERDRDLALSAKAREIVDDVDAALARLDAGTYGICVSSGEIIPKERLEVLPMAAKTVAAQTAMF